MCLMNLTIDGWILGTCDDWSIGIVVYLVMSVWIYRGRWFCGVRFEFGLGSIIEK